MKNSFLHNFFRKDLKLETRWWHRLFFVIFIIFFLFVLSFVINEMVEDGQFPKYKKIGL